eukprot:scaffold492_cov257-Pinguiococcus_pyrenoidosus.AAC.37
MERPQKSESLRGLAEVILSNMQMERLGQPCLGKIHSVCHKGTDAPVPSSGPVLDTKTQTNPSRASRRAPKSLACRPRG